MKPRTGLREHGDVGYSNLEFYADSGLVGSGARRLRVPVYPRRRVLNPLRRNPGTARTPRLHRLCHLPVAIRVQNVRAVSRSVLLTARGEGVASLSSVGAMGSALPPPATPAPTPDAGASSLSRRSRPCRRPGRRWRRGPPGRRPPPSPGSPATCHPGCSASRRLERWG